MKYLVIIIFIVGNISSAYATKCPEGHFPVRSHHRNAYIKTDGTTVSDSQVREQCRPYRIFKKLEPNFTTQAPKNWPNPSEKFKGWTKEEFRTSAEWKVNSDGKTLSLQRKKVSIQDSYIGPDEDFSNLIELYIQNRNYFKDQPILLKCLENFLK